MLNKTKFGGLVAAAVLAVGLAGQASAATITWSDGSGPGANTAPTSSTPVVLVDQLLSVDGLTKSPFEDSALYGVAAFNSVGKNASATYAYNSIRSTLKLIWGSVDTYNYIDFYRGADFVETFDGEDAGPVFTDNRSLSAMLASIIVSGGFYKVVLRSVGENAFEHARVSAVPVPAAGFLLIGALGGLAALRRRKQAA
jgi:hypothetical protein